MKSVQNFLAWLATLALASSTFAIEGCGASDKGAQTSAAAAPAPASQQPAAPTPAAAGAPADQAQTPIQLPDVALTAAGLDELLAPVALYPDPVLAIMLQTSGDPQQIMDGGNWLVLDANTNLKDS